ncbi:DUF29 domain-containing protein [Nostoc sp. XA010]|uniref:DUF29 domain-containing protein n=1 Tax=Nostoc sp. XA010 TaxID=2780407 RepID=UPI001E4D94EB|nr:DUF29 domain-containing protein [Nostoc sp. XA010]MCC5659733.1 DUF29 domain-containing protein [Nostoc sp. XA010]
MQAFGLLALSVLIFPFSAVASSQQLRRSFALPINTFPVECPYSIAQILDAEFLPDAIDL